MIAFMSPVDGVEDKAREFVRIADTLALLFRRNLENAVRHNKPMRGVDLSRTERLRIMRCFEVCLIPLHPHVFQSPRI